jgi:hypothetical protein
METKFGGPAPSNLALGIQGFSTRTKGKPNNLDEQFRQCATATICRWRRLSNTKLQSTDNL